jgi:hypothetical protein
LNNFTATKSKAGPSLLISLVPAKSAPPVHSAKVAAVADIAVVVVAAVVAAAAVVIAAVAVKAGANAMAAATEVFRIMIVGGILYCLVRRSSNSRVAGI